jgi:hypothetical protein
MTLYSRRTFNKESFQWTKYVVKYLYDTYSHLSLAMLSFLVEVLEKGPPAVQPSILTIKQTSTAWPFSDRSNALGCSVE